MRKFIVDLIRNGEISVLMESIRSGKINAEESGQLLGEFIYQATFGLDEEDVDMYFNNIADVIDDTVDEYTLMEEK